MGHLRVNEQRMKEWMAPVSASLLLGLTKILDGVGTEFSSITIKAQRAEEENQEESFLLPELIIKDSNGKPVKMNPFSRFMSMGACGAFLESVQEGVALFTSNSFVGVRLDKDSGVTFFFEDFDGEDTIEVFSGYGEMPEDTSENTSEEEDGQLLLPFDIPEIAN